MSNFFAFLARMKYINRWSLMRNTIQENIAEHSLQVCMIAHALAIIENKYFGGNYDANLIGMMGAYHETSEVITGDLPTPIKYYNNDMKTAYKQIEKVAANQILSTLPDELIDDFDPLINANENDYKLVKYADKLTAYIKCLEEVATGNKEFAKAKRSIEKELNNYNSKSVNYFIEHFIHAFTLSLDELSYGE